jgi:hypothetical protein
MLKARYKYFIQIFIASLMFVILNQWLVDHKWSDHTFKKVGLHLVEMIVITFLIYFIVSIFIKKRVVLVPIDQFKFILFLIWGIVMSIILLSQHK